MTAPVVARLDRWFELTRRGSTWSTELRGGLVTFATMAYIVVLNPLIIGSAKDVNGQFVGGTTDGAKAIAMVTAGTALVAGVMTVLMGVVGRFPVAMAAGLGLSGFVAYTLAPTMPWPAVMGLVVIEGVLMVALVVSGFRMAVFDAIPDPLKHAIGVGIGLFITLIGLVNAGIVRPGTPLVSLGVGGQLTGWPTVTFVLGLLVTIVLEARHVRGAILIGIVVTTVFALVVEAVGHVGARTDANLAGWGLTVPAPPDSFVSLPDLGALGQVDLFGAFQAVGALTAVIAVFSLVLPDFFDTMGTTFALANEGDLLDADGNIPHFEEILVVDSLAAAAGGVASVSSNTSFVESASGIGDGARTGIAAIVTGALFGVALFLTPLVAVIPYEAAAPALVVVGFLMMGQVRHIDFTDVTVGIPCFLTIALMPFTYSISNGIGAGFVTYIVLRAATGKARSIGWPTWVVGAAFLAYFAVAPIQALLA